MPMSLQPLGTLTLVSPVVTAKFAGPIAERAANLFTTTTWKSDLFDLSSPAAMALYLRGKVVAEVDNRVLFQDEDGALLVLKYLARLDFDAHVRGEAGAYLSGQIDVAESDEKYAFLTKTQVVGKAFPKFEGDVCYQIYEMYYLD